MPVPIPPYAADPSQLIADAATNSPAAAAQLAANQGWPFPHLPVTQQFPGLAVPVRLPSGAITTFAPPTPPTKPQNQPSAPRLAALMRQADQTAGASPATPAPSAAAGQGRGAQQPPAGAAATPYGYDPTQELQAAQDVRHSYDKVAEELRNKAKALAAEIPPAWNLDNPVETQQQLKRAQTALDESQAAYIKAIQQTPKRPEVDSLAHFGGLATIVGLLAGAFSRRPLTASLNAAGAAMEAYNQGDLRNYKMSVDQWKMQTDVLLKIADMNQKAIDNILTRAGLSERQRLDRLKILAEVQGLPVSAAEAEAQGKTKFAELSGNIAKARAELAKAQATQEEANSFRTLNLENNQQRLANQGWQVMQRPDGTLVRVKPATGEVQPVDLPAGSGRIAQAQAPVDKSEIEYWTRVIENGGTFPPGLARTSQGSMIVQQVMKNMASQGKIRGDMTPEDFIANVATVKADSHSLMNMTKMADAATSFERTAKENFDLALRLSKDAVPTNWGPWINKWVETAETGTGDPSVPAYVAALLTAANEYAKIMSGSTGAQGSTVDSRREAAQLFSPYLNAGQIDRVVAVAETDMRNRKQSLYGQIDDIKSRLRTAGSKQGTAAQGQPSTAAYRSANDVKADYQAGKLTREQAAQILKDHPEWGIQ